MASYRCSFCNLEWKRFEANKVCHVCGEKTWPSKRGEPMDDDEALELGGPAAIGKSQKLLNSGPTEKENELLIEMFADWLDTVGPDDFAASITTQPDRPQSG